MVTLQLLVKAMMWKKIKAASFMHITKTGNYLLPVEKCSPYFALVLKLSLPVFSKPGNIYCS